MPPKPTRRKSARRRRLVGSEKWLVLPPLPLSGGRNPLSPMSPIMNGQQRKDICPGLVVDIVLKQDQATGKLTRGVVRDILTSSPFHPHGVKVRLQDGRVGRVKEIVPGQER